MKSTSSWGEGVLCSYSSSVTDWHFFLRINPRALTLWVALFLGCGLTLAVQATPGLGASFTGCTGAAWSQIERGLSLRLSSNSCNSLWKDTRRCHVYMRYIYNSFTLCLEAAQTISLMLTRNENQRLFLIWHCVNTARRRQLTFSEM